MSRSTVLVGALGLWNYLINRVIPERAYVLANASAAIALAAAGRRQASRSELGFQVDGGAFSGLAAAGAVALAVHAASRNETLAPLFHDERVAADDVTYQAFVRIPLGTVLLEETAFRSVLPAVIDGADRSAVSWRSAALFGLWHVIPTRNTLDINGVTDPATRARAVGGAVVATAAAGALLDLLRIRTGSVVPPMMAHWSSNAVSYWIAARQKMSS